ncbi:DUF3040 domain-containing protein [Kitasatospora sp. NPDC007106]|uniref:DUF3040 domain-containing protein n=1 Tax=Kitasatospora sp. NPDC007106 TaxID=3156914 RepID=UPI003407BCED
MSTPLTEYEARTLDRIERHLRRTDPALDGLLGSRRSVRRLGWRPRFPALAVGVPAPATGGLGLCAAVGPTWAAGPAAVAAAALVLTFRRLARLGRG